MAEMRFEDLDLSYIFSARHFIYLLIFSNARSALVSRSCSVLQKGGAYDFTRYK
jgi:hypothetical protein